MSELSNVLIKSIGEVKEFGANGFKVVKFIVVDDRVDISYNLRGREWTNPQGEVKVFNSIEAWKVFKIDADGVDVPDFEEVSSGDLKDVTDDLPF